MTTKRNAPESKKLWADTVILPRDYNPWNKRRLKVLQDQGATELPIVENGGPGAKKVWCSDNRHVLVPEWEAPGAVSIRKQLVRIFNDATVTLYVDRRKHEPLRMAVKLNKDDLPEGYFESAPEETYLSYGDNFDLYLQAGYDINPPKDSQKIALSTMGLLTETTKMGCYSFNLPAGPPSLNGTCPASDLGFMYNTEAVMEAKQKKMLDRSVEIDPMTFVCNGCYALKGAYGNPSTIMIMQLKERLTRRLMENEGVPISKRKELKNLRMVSRENWTIAKRAANRLVREKTGRKDRSANDGQIVAYIEAVRPEMFEPVTASFSEIMALAMDEAFRKVAARRAKLEHFKYTEAAYKKAEYIMDWLVARKEARAMIDELNATPEKAEQRRLESDLKAHLDRFKMSVKDVLATGRDVKYKKTYSDWQLPDPKYFRIHDAGDFFDDEYFNAWLKVIKEFPKVNFWAPTRIWTYRGSVDLQSLKKVPKNLAMRPSALHFRDFAPSLEYIKSLGIPTYKKGVGGGLCAGTGAAPGTPTEKDWKCPAYLHWTAGGGAIRRQVAVVQEAEGESDEEAEAIKTFGGTCATATGPNKEKGCRACWVHMDLTVFYSEH